MGHITIKAYGKVMYDKEMPDKVAYAIMKERVDKDNEFKISIRKPLQKPEDIDAFR